MLLQAGRPDDALEAYNSLVDSYPEHPNHHGYRAWRGFVAAMRGDTAQALEDDKWLAEFDGRYNKRGGGHARARIHCRRTGSASGSNVTAPAGLPAGPTLLDGHGVAAGVRPSPQLSALRRVAEAERVGRGEVVGQSAPRSSRRLFKATARTLSLSGNVCSPACTMSSLSRPSVSRAECAERVIFGDVLRFTSKPRR